MNRFAKLLEQKRLRDNVDHVGAPIFAALQELSIKHDENAYFPNFYVSSAPAAAKLTLDINHLVASASSPSDIVRFVLIVAASVPQPDEVETESTPQDIDPMFRIRRVTLTRIGGGNTNDISLETVSHWKQMIEAEELAFSHDLANKETSCSLSQECHTVVASETTPLWVPVYYLRIPMQDDGSQRLKDVMVIITKVLDDIVRYRDARMYQNSVVLWKLLCEQKKVSMGGLETLQQTADGYSVLPGSAVLVHCLQGVSRSVSVVVWYLVEQAWRIGITGVDSLKVLEWMRTKRPCCCPNLCFAAEIRCMESRLKER